MIAFPHAKINIGLKILGKRKDGYHNIESILYPIAYRDALEIIPSMKFCISTYGIDIPVTDEDNLCTKAFHLLKEDYDIPNVKIVIYKNIPVMSGLGGGSSNAVYTLKLLDQIYDLGISDDELSEYAKIIGCDCPFFLERKPKIASGKGDILKNCNLDLKSYVINVVTPGFSISTKEAYSLLNHSSNNTFEFDKDIFQWKEKIENDFEKKLEKKYPELVDIKNALYKNGAIYSSISGSGSSVYGIFEKELDLKKEFPNYRVWQGKFY